MNQKLYIVGNSKCIYEGNLNFEIMRYSSQKNKDGRNLS